MIIPYNGDVRNSTRVRQINVGSASKQTGPVIYLMSQDQRAVDNHALSAAQSYAQTHHRSLLVVFVLYASMGVRLMQQFEWMVKGMKQVEAELRKLKIPLRLEQGSAAEIVPTIATEIKASAIFCDHSPLRAATKTRQTIASECSIPVYEVDASSVVPIWVASDKQEYAARTIRPKIHARLDEFLQLPAALHPMSGAQTWYDNDWETALQSVTAELHDDYRPIIQPGTDAARKVLDRFCHERLANYADDRNNPTIEGLSDLSAYLHFGQISVIRAVQTVRAFADHSTDPAVVAGADAFIEEIVVRRELARNFCFYNPDYDRLEGAPDWAQTTLDQHRSDRRDYLYSRDQLEQAQTHDDAWNAAQIQMMRTGKMHGYLRMYWAKKILEWSSTPEEAIAHAIYLNDRYELDGHDPNGYVGVLWAIAGVHDRPWTERPIFGKIRYMNFNGLKRKMPIHQYIDTWLPLNTVS